MEESGAESSIGFAVNNNLEGEKSEKLRQPTRRFVGRRTAAERADKNERSNSAIEDNGAVEGLKSKLP